MAGSVRRAPAQRPDGQANYWTGEDQAQREDNNNPHSKGLQRRSRTEAGQVAQGTAWLTGLWPLGSLPDAAAAIVLLVGEKPPADKTVPWLCSYPDRKPVENRAFLYACESTGRFRH